MICCTKFSINLTKNSYLTEIMLSTHLQATHLQSTQYTNPKQIIFWVNLCFTGLRPNDYRLKIPQEAQKNLWTFLKKIRQK